MVGHLLMTSRFFHRHNNLSDNVVVVVDVVVVVAFRPVMSYFYVVRLKG